jgi:hypothetical protein
MSLFRIGIPTDIDVRKLRERYPDHTLTPGMEISYAELCNLLGLNSHVAGRFKSVITAWRKALLRESGVILKAQEGTKFIVADNPTKAQLAIDKTKMATRAVRRSIIINKHIDRKALSEDQLKRLDFSQRFNASVLALQSVKAQAELPTI